MAKEIMIKGYACEECGKSYITEYGADICCKEYFCEDCGINLEKHHIVCTSCHEKRLFNRATKMKYEEYIQEHNGNMLIFNDKFFDDMEEIIEYCKLSKIDIPTYVWGTEKRRVEISSEQVEEWTLADTFEDAAFDSEGRRELEEFIDNWNSKYALDYYEDAGIAIFVPKNMIR